MASKTESTLKNMVLVLLSVALISATSLGYIYEFTKKPIEEAKLQKKLQAMQEKHQPIVIEYDAGHKNYVFYEDSQLLTQLVYYPYILIIVFSFFIILSQTLSCINL